MLRAGGGAEVTDESRSLFRIGAVCDVSAVTGALVACRALGAPPVTVFTVHVGIFALFPGGRVLDLGIWTHDGDAATA